MALRFEEATTDVVTFVEGVITKSFRQLTTAKIEIVMDIKKRKSGGRFQLAKLAKTNEVQRFISADNIHPDGADYILFLDKAVWTAMHESDRERIVRFALQHADVDFEKDMPYNIRKPEVLTFYEEIEFNKDDPRWSERLDVLAEQVYDPENEPEGAVE